MMAAEFLRTDDPPVLSAPHAARTCAACRFWSRWLPNTGDCMRWAYLRREELAASARYDDVREPKAARMTSIDETCAGWEARP